MGLLGRTREISLSQGLQKLTFPSTCIIKVLEACSVSLLWGNPSLLTLVLIITSVAIIVTGENRGEDICLYIAVFFIGSLTEVVAISYGAWEYSLPNVIGIPIWLPFGWGSTGVSTKRIYLKINRLNLPTKVKKLL